MKEFIYYQDEKVTILRRSTFSVKAKTKRGADELVRGLNGASIFDIRESKDVNPVGSDFLLETEVTLLPKDNGGNSTIEHYSADGTILSCNGGKCDKHKALAWGISCDCKESNGYIFRE